MKYAFATLILLFFTCEAYAQNQTNNWYFGNYAGVTFNTNPPSLLLGSGLHTVEGSTSISDINGNLLFYSDGVSVWDKNHNLMMNGTGLLGDISSTQSAIIVPMPGSTSLYYLFTTPFFSGNNPFAYSIIDMTLNNGFGDVTVKNVPLLTPSSEKQTVIQHQNGIDYWIIAHGSGNSFYAYLLTSGGISTPVISNSGMFIAGNLLMGYLKGSPCGNKLGMACFTSTNTSYLELYDFDNTTGIVSNVIQLANWAVNNGVYGVEFSPDNSKLYASIINPPRIYQYNLLAGSPWAIINSWHIVGFSPTYSFGALQTGPDGRIYIAKTGCDSLACITSPNVLGTSCGYVENYLKVSQSPSVCQTGLPSFPVSYFCNIPSGINDELQIENLSVYPNPFINEIYISIPDLHFDQVNLIIRNIYGQEVIERKLIQQPESNSFSIDLNNLSKGIYFVEVSHHEERIVRKIVKQ